MQLEKLEEQIKFGEGYRVVSQCGQVMEIAVFTFMEKKVNKIFCYEHVAFEPIKRIRKIVLE